jgi:hypothetical protein
VLNETFITTLLLTSFISAADVNRLQPAYLDISEQSAGKFSMLWKKPFASSKLMNI